MRQVSSLKVMTAEPTLPAQVIDLMVLEPERQFTLADLEHRSPPNIHGLSLVRLPPTQA